MAICRGSKNVLFVYEESAQSFNLFLGKNTIMTLAIFPAEIYLFLSKFLAAVMRSIFVCQRHEIIFSNAFKSSVVQSIYCTYFILSTILFTVGSITLALAKSICL
jgi:hypothetical protein